MQTCRNCGATVTDRFARVFGDNADTVYGCPNCSHTHEFAALSRRSSRNEGTTYTDDRFA